MWFLLLISLFLTTPETEPVETFTLFDFSNPDHAEFWSITNDGVMGGVSQGQWDAEEDRGIFSGFVSLDNNGGFSSVRAEFRPLNLSTADGIQLKVRGDGQKYSFNLRDVHSWLSHRITFETEVMEDDEAWQIIQIPFDELVPTRFGEPYPNSDAIDLENVWSMSILISDKQEGDFRLEMSEVSIYRLENRNEMSLAVERREI
jgi:NADH dehydrogenase [ubiquinone] 1 alpha subcomplex assembly factor 1